MVLKPLEFSDCLTDNPWFRQNLAEHEAALEKAYKTIKLLEHQCREMVNAAHSKLAYFVFNKCTIELYDTKKHILQKFISAFERFYFRNVSSCSF